MSYIPKLVPFNLTLTEVINNKTVFANADNTQNEKYATTPSWRQVIPSNTEIKFIVWADPSTQYGPIGGVSGAAGSISFTSESVDDMYTVTVIFTEEGEGSFWMDIDGYGHEHTSNTFTIVDELTDDNSEYAYLEYSHFKNSFDYWFIDGDTTNYYGIWVEKINSTPTTSTDIEYYEDDNNSNMVTNSTVNDGTEFIVPAVDRWFARLLNSVMACGDLRLNSIECVSNGAASIEVVEENVNAYNVTLSLTEK